MIHGADANCQFCAHYTRDRTCKAFPGGIPDVLWSGENLHDEHVQGDNGYLYEPRRGAMDIAEDILAERY